MLPVMLQLYNVREELKKDFDGTLKEVGRIGYKYVELAWPSLSEKPLPSLRRPWIKPGLRRFPPMYRTGI